MKGEFTLQEPIFQPFRFGEKEKAQLDRDGHFLLPGILTAATCQKLIAALARVEALPSGEEHQAKPSRFAAEYDDYLASLIAHPQMLALAHGVLGDEIRFDHCVSLNRPGGDSGIHWHAHGYADDRPELGFVRIFLYISGFTVDDGGLKVVPGSHHYREPRMRFHTDEELRAGWLPGKTHSWTGLPLEIEALEAPPGTVALMWTHAAHAVSPRRPDSDMRWAVVYAYRNPGAASHARWLSEGFETHPPAGAEALMSLF